VSRNKILIAVAVAIVIVAAVAAYFIFAPDDSNQGETEAASSTAASAPQAGAPGALRIVVIDRATILHDSKVGQDIARQVQAFADQAKKDLEGRGRALQAEGEKLQQQVAILSGDERQKRIAAFEAKQNAFRNEAAVKDAQIKQTFAVASGEVGKLLGPIVEGIVKERGASMVLDKQAVIYANSNAFDITSEAVDRLNQKMTSYKVTLAPPPK
jgi:Skp family chaperone for outer membrane proteins